MRSDFLLFPLDADNFEIVDPKYVNFTPSPTTRKDLAAGLERVQWYMWGLKRLQPWVHYALAMTITKDKAVFLLGQGSGERLKLIPADMVAVASSPSGSYFGG